MNVVSTKVTPTLQGGDLLSLLDYDANQIRHILDVAANLKAKQKQGKPMKLLEGKTLGMIFSKPSTRTRISFQTSMYQLGGNAIFLKEDDMQLSRGESVADTAKVLSGYLDGIMIRTYSQKMIEELAEHATIPVINGLTDMYHPCQALADLLTIEEQKGKLAGNKIAYIGDGNNVTHSLLIAAATMGMDVAIATPPGCEPDAAVLHQVKKITAKSGTGITVCHDPDVAVQDADVIYTDVWASMGEEDKDINIFSRFQVNRGLMQKAKPDAIFMHCLPAHRELEVTADVIDSKQSVVFQQAENRLHAQKAVLVLLLGDQPQELLYS